MKLDPVSGKHTVILKLADDAIYLERVLCNESGGVQDQIAASFGGLNRINFNADGYEVNPVIISPDRKDQLNRNLMLFFTGFSRFSSDIQKTTQKDMADKERQLLEMLSLVDEAERVLTTKTDLNEFGRLLDYTWKLKRGSPAGSPQTPSTAYMPRGSRPGLLAESSWVPEAAASCCFMWRRIRERLWQRPWRTFYTCRSSLRTAGPE